MNTFKPNMGLNSEQIDRWLLDFYVFVHHKHGNAPYKMLMYTSYTLIAMIVCVLLAKFYMLPK
jgi:hypothetical protein